MNAAAARARIQLALAPAGVGATALRAAAAVPAPADRESAVLYVALYENGLSNRVAAGENRGATLTHDYVVRDWWGPAGVDAAGNVTLESSFATQRVARGGVAAFVQSRRSGEVLQALALSACS